MIEETLAKLKQLSLKGPIKAEGTSANEVGKIFRRELGINHSTSSKNKLNGFTISSTAQAGASRNNLFAKVPDWKNSNIKSTLEFLNLYGNSNPQKNYSKSLFCTVTALSPNSFGLQLKVDRENKKLYEISKENGTEKYLLEWDMATLNSRLANQDKKIIVTAIKNKRKDGNYFHYRYAEFFLKPEFEEFLNLIEFGQINLDHLIFLEQDKKSATEKGPTFKISKDGISQLFSEYRRYDLMD